MNPGTTRRRFLELTGAAAGMSGLTVAAAPNRRAAEFILPQGPATARPKIAALATVYSYLSHAYHIVGRFLDGFVVHDGNGLHKPQFEVASLFIEQTPAPADLGREQARRHGVRLCPTIADALTLGTGKLAVDAVLLIAEHGTYPYNQKLQKLYPRGKFFREVLDVFRSSGRAVPVFIDKHLSYSRSEAGDMLAQAQAQSVPIMAGSSLPVTWRLPPLEIPLGRPFKEVVVASRGDLEIFGFHALETLQCMVERRHLGGKTQGVAAVTCLEGDAVWEAGDRGVWSWTLVEHALRRSHTRNIGDIKQNTRDYVPPPAPANDAPTKLRHPIAFVVEYVDGLRATVLILNGHVDDTTIAARIGGPVAGGESIVSTLMYLPAPPAPASSIRSCCASKTSFARDNPPTPCSALCSPAGSSTSRSRAASAITGASKHPSSPRSTTGRRTIRGSSRRHLRAKRSIDSEAADTRLPRAGLAELRTPLKLRRPSRMRKLPEYPLWIGHVGDARDVSRLLETGISAVVDLALNEPPLTLPRELVYCRFPLIDGAGNPRWILRAAIETVALLLRTGTPALVCCGAGISRSPAIAAAAIAVVRECSPADGLAIAVRSGTADISPALWAEIQAALV